MITITILLEEADRYRALAGDKESPGRTAGEALDALTSQLSDNEADALVIIQDFEADQFFSAAQQERLTELMRLRDARTLSQDEERELEGLVEAELDGVRLRAESILEQRQGANTKVRQRRRAKLRARAGKLSKESEIECAEPSSLPQASQRRAESSKESKRDVAEPSGVPLPDAGKA